MRYAGPVDGRLIREQDGWWRVDIHARGHLCQQIWVATKREALAHLDWATTEIQQPAELAEGTIER